VNLLLLDLDDTLVDRAGAFRAWAQRFVHQRGGSNTDVDRLIRLDADGHADRELVAAGLRELLDIDVALDDLVDAMLVGVVNESRSSEAIRASIRAASAAGWTPVVVTNGLADRQERKLRCAGLDDLVAGWAISEAVGFRKPDPRIFEAAAAIGEKPLTGAWMIGDNAEADVGGAVAVGINSVWLHRGRPWPDLPYAPTRQSDSCAGAIRDVVDHERG
jgi:putative hydrolase of the HAD superfamily